MSNLVIPLKTDWNDGVRNPYAHLSRGTVVPLDEMQFKIHLSHCGFLTPCFEHFARLHPEVSDPKFDPPLVLPWCKDSPLMHQVAK